MKIAVTTDHAGFEALGELKQYLAGLGHECIDYGPSVYDKDDDYPDYMFPAAQAVAGGECDAGIILGGSGQGEAMAANRLKGVRCTLFYGPVRPQHAVDAQGAISEDPYEILRLSRQHNHANVLSLGARFLNFEEMKQAVEIWLTTPYSPEPRHVHLNCH